MREITSGVINDYIIIPLAQHTPALIKNLKEIPLTCVIINGCIIIPLKAFCGLSITRKSDVAQLLFFTRIFLSTTLYCLTFKQILEMGYMIGASDKQEAYQKIKKISSKIENIIGNILGPFCFFDLLIMFIAGEISIARGQGGDISDTAGVTLTVSALVMAVLSHPIAMERLFNPAYYANRILKKMALGIHLLLHGALKAAQVEFYIGTVESRFWAPIEWYSRLYRWVGMGVIGVLDTVMYYYTEKNLYAMQSREDDETPSYPRTAWCYSLWSGLHNRWISVVILALALIEAIMDSYDGSPASYHLVAITSIALLTNIMNYMLKVYDVPTEERLRIEESTNADEERLPLLLRTSPHTH